MQPQQAGNRDMLGKSRTAGATLPGGNEGRTSGGSMVHGSAAPARRVLLVSTNYAPEQAGIGP
ncbi:hypothetical protein, partial [Streptomyces albus]|uniref:hypothetical protein n=1 Tax=Streptomyces albus TaxID=1888 RepID=UPI0024E0CEEA